MLQIKELVGYMFNHIIILSQNSFDNVDLLSRKVENQVENHQSSSAFTGQSAKPVNVCLLLFPPISDHVITQ